MFYSHEILTSREHGVATVWLVATLGAKSTTRKVNRKAILEVDVPKACDMIIRPDAPMALRLQGNLLYGVSKVYHQQCGYALLDAEATRDRMRTMLKVIHSASLDPDAGKARPDQIMLPHDPTFIPELMLPGLNVDLSTLDIGLDWVSPRKSSLVSSYVPKSTASNKSAAGELQLNLSSSDIGGFHTGDALGYISEMSSARKEPQVELPAYFGDEAGILLQPDFEFDGDGNIIELFPKKTAEPRESEVQVRDDRLSTMRNTGVGLLTGEHQPDGDIVMDDIDAGQDEMAGSLLVSDGTQPRGQVTDPDYSNVPEISSETGEVVKTHFRRKKLTRMFGVDEPAELRNSDLAQWNSEYAENMAAAARSKVHNRLVTIAKKNAAFWVLGSGIGAVGVGLGSGAVLHPLAAFSGDQLLASLTGAPCREKRRKRNHDEKEDADASVGKRARIREEDKDDEPEIGLGEAVDVEEGLGLVVEDIEVGRQAPSSLRDDDLSNMPWNITASIKSKSSARASSVYSRQIFAGGGVFSSIGGPRSVVSPGPDGMPSASNAAAAVAAHRRGRLTSASPLAGRGNLQLLPSDQEMDLDIDTFSGIDAAHYGDDEGDGQPGEQPLGHDNANDDDDERRGIQGPKWLRSSSSLDQETVNFYEYLQARIEEKEQKKEEEKEDRAVGGSHSGVSVSFTSLLPPRSSSRIVATQALLHVLTLATNGALRVRQDVANKPRSVQDTGDIILMLG
ncbi:Rad21/Rec8 N terminal domain-containing protein [Nannizzia gypsea CBS 118893]|uniref:Rad21/Rec8 N terminal domain-containing protein n=1 Tax=Arthroderma gypseum (strain ATCC MYA-4604 / CBS 118893) TaxID=535722 RepID=E5QYA4_ARTGP|nr:Rad21/Rec8 N terminal domain-containing protein [Nannizzia gypsea CBS 118893]EFQ97196.1 Rad21/Rec8 N terminal domain-containing protein [Nannizzia gypsea CBS 118893]